jgi:hypothetical protein
MGSQGKNRVSVRFSMKREAGKQQVFHVSEREKEDSPKII